MLNTLNILSLSYLNDICIYRYDDASMYTSNKDLNIYLKIILNNDNKDYYKYVFIIDYSNMQLNIDIYTNNNAILYNINYDLYNNKDAFKTLNDFILNKDNDLNYSFNYKVLTINKASLTIE